MLHLQLLQIDIAQVGKVTLIISRQPFICRQPIISLGQQICCPEAEGLNTVEDLHDWLSSQHSWLPLRISPALVLLLLLLQLLVKLHSSNSFIKCVIKLAAPADWPNQSSQLEWCLASPSCLRLQTAASAAACWKTLMLMASILPRQAHHLKHSCRHSLTYTCTPP